MEFGFEPVCDQVRAGSSYLDMSRLLERARIWSQTGSKPNSITLSWSQTELVADLQQAVIWPIIEHELAGLRPASDLSATSFGMTCLRPNSVMEFGFEPVCNQIRACSSYLDMSR